MPLRSKSIGPLMIAALAVGLVSAQSAAPPPPPAKPAPAAQDEEPTFRTETRLVPLYLSISSKEGRPVNAVKQGEVKVFENKVEQPIRVFRREDVPISLGIVIDNSGSMRDKRQKVEAAAVHLVKGTKNLDQVFVVNFNDDAFLDVPFTNEITKMEEGVARIDSRGGTALYDAMSMSIDHMKAEGKKDKKVLLIITDGNDTTSTGINLEKLIEKAQRSEILVYAIAVLSADDKRDAKRAKRALELLTRASGGMAFFPESLSEVEAISDQVAEDIRNQYVLAYSPTNQNLDGSYRQITVTAGKNLVRTRTGYYATPYAPPKKTVSPPGSGY